MVAAVAVLVVAPGAQAARTGSPWTWIDRAPQLYDVSCSTPADCVSVGEQGVVLRSTPGLDQPLAWSGVGLTFPEALVGVTCNAQRCLAVSDVPTTELSTYVSKVFRSTDGGATWSPGVALPAWDKDNPTRVGSAIACDPDAANCYVAGRGGGIWRSNDDGLTWDDLPPTKRHFAWTRLACPATGTCVLVGGDDDFSSAVVTGRTTTEVEPPAGATAAPLAVACDQPDRCVATTGNDSFLTMDVPAKKWGPARPVLPGIKALSVRSLSCPQVDTCIGTATGAPGSPVFGVRTINLSSASGGWERRPLGSNVSSISCVATSCVAAGRYAAWYATFNIGIDWGRVNEVAAFDAGQCLPSMNGNCVAGGEKDIGVSHSGGDLWTLPLAATPGLNIKAVNCSGPTTCLLLGKNTTLFSSDLEGFGTRFATTTDPAGTDALACSTDVVCEGAGEGVTYTTFDGALTSWAQSGFPTRPTSMACLPGRTDPAVCVATTRDFVYRGTMTRTGGLVHWNWIATVDPAEALEAIACSPGGQCTGVGPNGDVVTSQDPALLEWKEYTIPEGGPPDARPLFKAVACPGDGVCVAGGVHGNSAVIASTTNNWADYSYETIGSLASPTPTITGFACRDVNTCLAMGRTVMLSGARTG